MSEISTKTMEVCMLHWEDNKFPGNREEISRYKYIYIYIYIYIYMGLYLLNGNGIYEII